MAHKILLNRGDVRSLKMKLRPMVMPRVRATFGLGQKIKPDTVMLTTGFFGGELIPDPLFDQWAVPGTPDGWLVVGTDATNIIEEGVPTGLRFVSDDTVVNNPRVAIDLAIDVGHTYTVEYEYSAKVAGNLTLVAALGTVGMTAAVGIRSKIMHLVANSVGLQIWHQAGVCDCTLSYLSIKESP